MCIRDSADRFAALNKDNLDLLGELYSDDLLFRDPLHEVHCLTAVRRYFAELYANVEALHFEFHGFDQVAEGEGYMRWTMRYRHQRLRGGAEIAVEGCSHLLWREHVYQHRDYFDAGALLY